MFGKNKKQKEQKCEDKKILATAANKMAHNACNKVLIDYKKRLVERITKEASIGRFCTVIKRSGRDDWKHIAKWLQDLGFDVSWEEKDFYAFIRWDDVSITKIEMVTKPKSATVTYVEELSKIEFGWNYDTTRYDFVCSCCNEHSEYTSNYCPHCGAKMYVPNGDKRRDY